MAVMSAARLTQLWEKDLTKEFFDEYDRWPAVAPNMINVSNNTSDHYIKEGLMTSLGSAPAVNDGQAFPFDAYYQGPEKTVYFNEYGIAVQATRVMMEDDRHGIMRKFSRELAKAMNYTVELQSWDLINSGFGTTRLGIDGLALFSASHPLYGPAGGTLSNLLTGSLSKLNIQAAVDLFSILTNERGIPIFIQPPFTLLIHPKNRWMATILGMSQLDPDSASNAVNPVKGTFQFKEVPFFTSTTQWALGSKADWDLRWIWRRKIKYEPAIDFITGNVLWKAHMRALATFFHWRGIVGSAG